MASIDYVKKRLYVPFIYAKAKKLGSYVLDHLKQSESILDVGCGDMIVAQHFQKQLGKKIVGLDVIDIRLSNLSLKLYNGNEFPFPDNSFDTVYAIFSLHHCANEQQVLKEMKRVARKKIIIVEEVYNNIFEKYYVFAHDWITNRLESLSMNIPFHFHTDKTWKKYIKKLELKLIHEQQISQLPWFLAIPLLTFTPIKMYILQKD